MMPVPLASNRSKASLTSAFCGSVSSYLYPLPFAFFLPGPDPEAAPFAGNVGTGAGFILFYTKIAVRILRLFILQLTILFFLSYI
tara:strand:- start:76 stop:330 length:255 start_codon:yes stop_codon:yes gene_type:complete